MRSPVVLASLLAAAIRATRIPLSALLARETNASSQPGSVIPERMLDTDASTAFLEEGADSVGRLEKLWELVIGNWSWTPTTGKSQASFHKLSSCIATRCAGEMADCGHCFLDHGPIAQPLMVNGLSTSYAEDMLSLLKPGANYRNKWCEGKVAGCKPKQNFPGAGTTSIPGWQEVWDQGKKFPEWEWSGKIWRGSQLGLIIYNPYFFSKSGIYPYAITLGITPKQHAVVRPMMDHIFNVKPSHEALIRKILVSFLFERRNNGEMDVSQDYTIWTNIVLHALTFGKELSYEEAKENVDLMIKLKSLGTFSQLVPAALYRAILGPIRDKVAKIVLEYQALVGTQYATFLKGKDCAPSQGCTEQAAASIFDTLFFAGGLSVPSVMHTGTGLLYSTHATNPYTEGNIPEGKNGSTAYVWENIRAWPPVVGFPRFEKRPLCPGMDRKGTDDLQKPNGESLPCPKGPRNMLTGFPPVNQYAGGKQSILMLALALEDPSKWGSDADTFKIRDIKLYEAYGGVAFAQMARDKSVANGHMDRNCPGQDLAILMARIFFEVFQYEDWVAEKPAEIKFGGVTANYCAHFKLKRSSGASRMSRGLTDQDSGTGQSRLKRPSSTQTDQPRGRNRVRKTSSTRKLNTSEAASPRGAA